MTLPRKEGGRGLQDLKFLHDSQINNLRDYFISKTQDSELHRIVVKYDDNFSPLNLSLLIDNVKLDKNALVQSKLKALIRKPVQGRHEAVLAKEIIDRDASNAWLDKAGLFPETEGMVIAIQEEMINTRNRQKFITEKGNIRDDRCRLCHHACENIQHILSGCLKLAGSDYLHRHNQVAKIVHQKLALREGFVNELKPYYKYSPKSVLENKHCKLYWDRTILTDMTVSYNRPDIVFINKKSKVGYLIDIAVPNSHNIEKKVNEKVEKYIALGQEMIRSFKLNKIEVIPIVISATGVVPYSLHSYIDKLGLKKHIFLELQKAVLLSSCRIVRKFMQIEC